MHLLTQFPRHDLKMLLCGLLSLVIGSVALTVNQAPTNVADSVAPPPIDVADSIARPPIDVADSVARTPIDVADTDAQTCIYINGSDNVPVLLNVQNTLGIAKARPKITGCENGPPYEMKLDGSGSRGLFFKWEQIKGDRPGYTSRKKTFVYRASKTGYYKWSLTVWIIPFIWGNTAYVSCTAGSNKKPVARANMYWLGNSIYMDASKSTDDHYIVKYEWKQLRGNNPGYRSTAKAFLYRTTYNGYYRWKLTVWDKERNSHSTVISQDFRQSGGRRSVTAVITALWFTTPIWRWNLMYLTGFRSSGRIAKYVWIMEKGPDPGRMKYGVGMFYGSRTGGLYIWKLLVIGVDNTYHYTSTKHYFGSRWAIFKMVRGKGGLRAVPKLIQGINNITLDATSSTGDISRVQWEQINGDHIGDTSAELRFSIPYPHSGECTYKLTVFAKNGEVAEDEVSLPDGDLDNWHDLIGIGVADLVEEPDTSPEALEGPFDEDGNDVDYGSDWWPSPNNIPFGNEDDNPFMDYGNATDVGNPQSDNPPE